MTLYAQRAIQQSSAIETILWQTTLSLPFFICLAAFFETMPHGSPGLKAVSGVVYHALAINAFGFVVRGQLIARYGAGVISSFFLLSPFVSVVLSYLLLDEPISLGIVISSCVLGLGIWLIYPRSTNLKNLKSN